MNAIVPAPQVVHHRAGQRFEYQEESQVASLLYERTGEHVTFKHTYVPGALRGRGVATKLIRAALNEARRCHWTVTARCPFVAVYLERNPEFARLARGATPADDGTRREAR